MLVTPFRKCEGVWLFLLLTNRNIIFYILTLLSGKEYISIEEKAKNLEGSLEASKINVVIKSIELFATSSKNA